MSIDKLSPEVVVAAARRLEGVVNRTPVMKSRTLNALASCQVFLKCENFQRVGAFKFRGAYNAVSQLSPDQKSAGVITHSSGNHAQGLALAAQLLGVRAVIVMPDDSPVIKREATAGYGAEIISCRAIEREEVCAREIDKHGYTLIHPYDNDQIIAGAGTAALELIEEVGPIDVLLVPVGGGGLISGSALGAAAIAPSCRVIGVEPELGDDANRSWRDNEIVKLDFVPATIADGLRTRSIGIRNLAVMRHYVSDMTTVTEAEIGEALRFIWSRLKIVVEPSSAVALAPLLSGHISVPGARIGVILSGGNVDMSVLTPSSESTESSTFRPKPFATGGTTESAASSRPRILVTDEMDETGLALLREFAEVHTKIALDQDELLEEIGHYQALVVGPTTHLTEQTIEYGFDLRAIGTLSSRLDNIDVSTARNMGIEICVVPGGRAVSIAEHTMARLLRLADEFTDGHLAGKTLGIIGFGRVGRQVARRALAFDMRVIVNQPRLTPQLALSAGAKVVDLADLLRQADYVSLHVPFKAETDAIIGEDELALMKSTACLINTGHTDLVDEAALWQALERGSISAAALSNLPHIREGSSIAKRIRRHKKVIVSPHVSTIIYSQRKETAVAVANQLRDIFRASQTSETLSLELVRIEQIAPHEQIDDKRVSRLMERLENDGRLVNPPVTAYWKGRYVILDGATRFTAFQRLGYAYLIVQVVHSQQAGFELHTWYHVISSDRPFSELQVQLQSKPDLILTAVPGNQIQSAFGEKQAICYLLDREGKAILVQVREGADRLSAMNELVASYSKWGSVERTLLTDLPRLLGQFPGMAAVAVFPQFRPEVVFDVATQGRLLPAGLTRFVIPGRILRLNADLNRLRQAEPIAAKRAWLNRFLEDKLARSRMRFYQEPVILLDE